MPSALTQRALAYQEAKMYDPAIEDLNTLLAKYPAAREREAALQQKALILGQQDNAKGMSDAFRQLLKEFPKSSVAAQANYYIGKAAFEAKDYKGALGSLDAARQSRPGFNLLLKEIVEMMHHFRKWVSFRYRRSMKL